MQQRFRFAGFNPVPFKTIVFIGCWWPAVFQGLYTVQKQASSAPQFCRISISRLKMADLRSHVAAGGPSWTIIGAVLRQLPAEHGRAKPLPELWLVSSRGVCHLCRSSCCLMASYGWVHGRRSCAASASFGIAESPNLAPKSMEQIGESLQEVVSTTPTILLA